MTKAKFLLGYYMKIVSWGEGRVMNPWWEDKNLVGVSVY